VVVRIDCSGAGSCSTPDKGINAIEELMTQLQKFKKLKIKDMSLNVGLIGGGEKANVVPEKAWAICDLRFWNSQDLNTLKTYLRELRPGLKGARVKASLPELHPADGIQPGLQTAVQSGSGDSFFPWNGLDSGA